MGYSPPKCTYNGSTQTHSSKPCKSLLKCLHDMDENVTHPLPCLNPSLTPSRMSKPRVRKTLFSKQKFLFLKTYYRVSVKSIRQPSEANLLDNSPKKFIGPSDVNYWTISQPNSPENLPLKFFSQPFSIFFHVMHSHLLI